jgi:hypothetical protein|nr:MAG TPA: hypothetical protein [Caudoviricetes sp.]
MHKIKENLLEIYTIAVLFIGIPLSAWSFWGVKVAFAVFLFVQTPFLLFAIKNGGQK